LKAVGQMRRKSKMIEIINFILGIIFIMGMGFFAYMSSVLVSEKKERERNSK